jgi:hypothetical protein
MPSRGKGESDLGFVFEFLPWTTENYSDAYFGLLTALEQLFDIQGNTISRAGYR